MSTEEEEKEYTITFYDGRVRRMFGKLSDFQRLPAKSIEPATTSLFSNLLPMHPNEGPPLPRAFGIQWPGR